jgi:hypothetical protein
LGFPRSWQQPVLGLKLEYPKLLVIEDWQLSGALSANRVCSFSSQVHCGFLPFDLSPLPHSPSPFVHFALSSCPDLCPKLSLSLLSLWQLLLWRMLIASTSSEIVKTTRHCLAPWHLPPPLSLSLSAHSLQPNLFDSCQRSAYCLSQGWMVLEFTDSKAEPAVWGCGLDFVYSSGSQPVGRDPFGW